MWTGQRHDFCLLSRIPMLILSGQIQNNHVFKHSCFCFQGFPFLFSQVRDNINLRQTCNLIFSLCRWNDNLANAVSVIKRIVQCQSWYWQSCDFSASKHVSCKFISELYYCLSQLQMKTCKNNYNIESLIVSLCIKAL